MKHICTVSFLGSLLLLIGAAHAPLHAAADTATVRRMISAVSQDSLAKHIRTLERAGGYYNRISYTPGNDTVVRYIYNTMKGYTGLSSVAYDTFYMASSPFPYNAKPLVNVIGMLLGAKEPEKFFLVGGHLDCSASRTGTSDWPSKWETIAAPGADDNATGVSAVLELARIFSDSAFRFSSDYSLLFIAFGNEEGVPNTISPGLAGSAHFAQEAKLSGKNILGLINLDMLGYNPQMIYADVVSNAASVWIGQKCLDANSLYGLGITTNSVPFIEGGYSDHYSFWPQGYPAILLIEHAWPWATDAHYTASPHYHKFSDTLGTLNMPMVRAITQMTLGAVATIGTSSATAVRKNPIFSAETELGQNYPNPFNGTTTFLLRIPIEQHITLTIFDLLGREVVRLIDKVAPTGTLSLQWDSGSLPSGVYLYQLQTGRSTTTRPMLLIR